jgi:hypothetical protein
MKDNLPEVDWRKVDRAAQRAAATISKAIDRMIAGVPEYVSPHMATVYLVRELTRIRPTTMQQIMEEHLTRDAYEDAVSEIPATRGRTDV